MKNTIKIILAILGLCLLGAIGFSVFGRHRGSVVPSKQASSSWEGTWTKDGSTNYSYAQIVIHKNAAGDLVADFHDADNDASDKSGAGPVGFVNLPFAQTGSSATISGYGNGNVLCGLTVTLAGSVLTASNDPRWGNYGECYRFPAYGLDYGGAYHQGAAMETLSVEDTAFFKNNPDAYPLFASMVGTSLDGFEGALGDVSSNDPFDKDLKIESDSSDGAVDIVSFPHDNNADAVIFLGPGNQMWAFITDNYGSGSDDDSTLDYFTNVPEWQNKLPPWLQQWKAKNYDDPTDGNTDSVKYLSGKDKAK